MSNRLIPIHLSMPQIIGTQIWLAQDPDITDIEEWWIRGGWMPASLKAEPERRVIANE